MKILSIIKEIYNLNPAIKHIIILNDGTDELFNMRGISASSLEDFEKQMREMFGDYDSPSNYNPADDDFGDDADFNLEYWTYLPVLTESKLEEILEISNKNDNTEEEYKYLDELADKFISYDELKRVFK